MRVGLTGGIGSGKSAVARLFSDWGAAIIDTDVLAREVVAPGSAGFAQIAHRWPAVVNRQGSLDRAALARIVFADPAARDALTGIIHPRVRERAAEREAAAQPGAIVVHVVPLLFESDYAKTCDKTVLVVAPQPVRIARVIERDALTPEAVEARMAAQIDPVRAAGFADYVIENDGDLGVLEQRARSVYAALQSQSAA